MSIDHVSRALAMPTSVNGTTRVVLFVLAEAANTDTNECWPGTRTIARRAGIVQEKYVVKALDALVSLGLIEVELNGCPDRRIRADRLPNLYRMVGDMAVIDGGARRASGGARRAATGVRDAPASPLSREPEVEPEREPGSAIERTDGRMLFVEFWNVYPRKVGKPSAERAWAKAVRHHDPVAIIDGARRYAADPNRDPRFTKHPGPWLNDERWNDDPLPPRAGTGPSPRQQRKAEAMDLFVGDDQPTGTVAAAFLGGGATAEVTR